MRRLAAASGVLPAADLDLEVLEGGSKLGPEKEVEHVAAVGLGIVVEQPGGCAALIPDTLERPASVGAF